jgi:nitrite reductase (NADH) large subunit
MFYIRTADRLQRTAPWLESMEGGLDHLREVIMDDKLGICDELDAAMVAHVSGYRDEWRGVLEDPIKLSRFASFVNAPEMPDPTIEFVERRGQLVPVGYDRGSQPVMIAGPRLEVAR